MQRPPYINLPVQAKPTPSAEVVVVDANGIAIASCVGGPTAQWLATLINGTADTPADPDAGLSEGARSLIASVREYDAKPDVWKASLRFEASPMFGATVGGREGGAA